MLEWRRELKETLMVDQFPTDMIKETEEEPDKELPRVRGEAP